MLNFMFDTQIENPMQISCTGFIYIIDQNYLSHNHNHSMFFTVFK